MKSPILAAIAAAAVLAGCADSASDSRQRVVSVSPINDAELRPYNGLGPGSISGRAALGQATCAGSVVRLVPAITAVRETYEAFNRGQNVTTNPNRDIRVTSVRRQTVCDGEGRFRFANLPEGQWVVATEIRASGGKPSRLVHRLVTARAGSATEVALGERDVVNLPNARMAGS